MDTLFGQEGQCGEIESTNTPIKDKNLRLHSLLFVCCLELKTGFGCEASLSLCSDLV